MCVGVTANQESTANTTVSNVVVIAWFYDAHSVTHNTIHFQAFIHFVAFDEWRLFVRFLSSFSPFIGDAFVFFMYTYFAMAHTFLYMESLLATAEWHTTHRTHKGTLRKSVKKTCLHFPLYWVRQSATHFDTFIKDICMRTIWMKRTTSIVKRYR